MAEYWIYLIYTVYNIYLKDIHEDPANCPDVGLWVCCFDEFLFSADCNLFGEVHNKEFKNRALSLAPKFIIFFLTTRFLFSVMVLL